MSVTRDFDAMLAERAGTRPTFKVGGQEFTLRAKFPYSQWHKLLAVMRSDDIDPMTVTADFFESALVRRDRQRFRALLEKSDSKVSPDGVDINDEDEDDLYVIDFTQIDDLTEWAMAHFTGKHPTSADGSSPGAKETGPVPSVVSLQSKRAANGS